MHMDKIIRPITAIRGQMTVPGDKSISHRSLLLGAIAQGKTTIQNLSSAADVNSTRTCLEQLGVSIAATDHGLEIIGHGLYGLKASRQPLDCGNSGTTMRLLSGILAAQPFVSQLDGDESLRRRPMKRIIEPLSLMGASIESQPGGLAPLTISGNRLKAITYRSPIASAQVKSCILLAGLYAEGTTTVIEPQLSRDHTERMLTDFGVSLEKNGLAVSISGQQMLRACDITVPGDFSSAAFFIAAALLIPGSQLLIKNVCLNPTRIGLLEVLNEMGAAIQVEQHYQRSTEPVGDVAINAAQLYGTTIGPERIPSLIDEVPILAVIATQAHGITNLTGASELRVKESDRLQAVVNNLRAMGAEVAELPDGFTIIGPQELRGAQLDSFNDHRIAMAFSIAGLIAAGETQIMNSECVQISMPNFFETLQEIAVE
ncbi:MAG: 3-phosphoshikimate 1-carboxyvinyltransferase [candidate division KSB1 bacterium]|nr:3-phosphoshikimate 1-carboxyvinyltransferase [candidate division KSB1 bacterium]MDZ7336220.1 3-phosphoshikimate 1-carboxyvinyltransferase [candidate division KSB1 bacterium]MDZ7357619.1 3-phosphoshikimate 1-carboxyvinyltransferase [candidate division KSB1 bacterium]MDZ7401568.1 3-phosphoshikimate 1-carboxyvinyltransferase [candidate division KSB1 bacterium]